MTDQSIKITTTAEGVLISGLTSTLSAEKGSSAWEATALAGSRVLLFPSGQGANPGSSAGVAFCSNDMLYDLLFGMNHRRWSGMVLVDLGFVRKKLYFSGGECVFAASDLMDDRLGEVIYREDVISLEQLTNFAVQVDRKTKFGQVLLKSGDFSNTDLWNALKSQVREIFRSVFLVDHSYIEMHQAQAPVEVAFEEGTSELLDSAYSFGSQFRAFSSRIVADESRVFPHDDQIIESVQPGTFIGDILELCKDGPLVREVVERSKLTQVNTLVALHDLHARGLVRLEGLAPVTSVNIESSSGGLKSAIDAYQMLHQVVKGAFSTVAIKIPIKNLNEFALGLNADGSSTIYLDDEGALMADSVHNILQQCAVNRQRVLYFRQRVGALTRYLLQMSGDLLPFDVAKKVKKEFQEIAQ
jgi:hypothetical protein